MSVVREKFRPKHQVLILKCYPRFQKSAQDVKPNSSELSYLLYYASTRRSKLQKVGAFLEKKAASDVSRIRIGNVQVTLQILTALISKLPRELPLYAPFVLRILSAVLRSKDISLVEESIPTFEAFCKHHDVATLAADQEHIGHYEDLIRAYAGFAALKTPIQPRGGLNASIAVRWRNVGLRALRSVTSSEAVGADGGRQMSIIMPIILQNLHAGDEGHLRQLLSRANVAEGLDKEQTRRRMSIATIQTSDGNSSRPNSNAVAGTVDDADQLAEEEVGEQALMCLKQLFVCNNRAQLRLATTSMLRFICTVTPQRRPETHRSSKSGPTASWPSTLVEITTRWAPVQDRFVILVAIMETLIRSPVLEENLDQQLLLVSLIDWLLRSDINMIGLSVMDVLLGLVQHILLLLQLGGRGSNVLPHHQQTDAIDLFKGAEDAVEPPALTPERGGDESIPSSNRQELLDRLQRCIGDLATHIYYADQVTDMISAILLRLKPSPMSGVRTDTAAIEHPQAAAQAIQDSVRLQENPETDEFFSFGTARVTALRAIKQVLIVANLKNTVGGAGVVGRNRVGVQVWEGTQWLLRDEDKRVRRAYVDSLLTWLKLEMSSNDLRVLEDKRQMLRSTSRSELNSIKRDTMTKRAVSNASKNGKTEGPSKSTFLQLLHLAIYDNAIESPESEADLLLVHLLLVNLIEKLGVNAAKTGLPMIMRLQEDINLDEVISTPTAKLNVGSLVHGYFWELCEKFDFDASTVGLAVQREISRRKQHGLWLDTIQVPPLPMESIMTAASRPSDEVAPLTVLQTESIKPFDARDAMVDRIAESYANSIASPPTSPPASPGRVFSMPVVAQQSFFSPRSNHQLPPKIIDAMLADWSKETCISAAEKASIRTVSLNGSRKGTNLSQYLGVNGFNSRNPSPTGAQSPMLKSNANQGELANQTQGLNFPFQNDHRRSSAQDTESATPLTSSDQNQTLRVDDLKRVLSGGSFSSRGASPLRHNTAQHDFTPKSKPTSEGSSSESIASAEGVESTCDGDLPRSPPPAPINVVEHTKLPNSFHTSSSTHSRRTSNSHPRSRPHSGVTDTDKPPSTPRSLRRPSTSSSGEDPTANAAALRGEIVYPRLSSEADDDEVPPVPPLPAGVQASPRPISTGQIPSAPHQPMEPVLLGKKASRASTGRKKGVDVTALLGSIDAVAGEKWKGGAGRAPY